jgi:hypothetical protein
MDHRIAMRARAAAHEASTVEVAVEAAVIEIVGSLLGLGLVAPAVEQAIAAFSACLSRAGGGRPTDFLEAGLT